MYRNKGGTMRIFINPLDMLNEVERDLVEMGTKYQSATVQDQDVKDDPDFQTIELVGYAYMLAQFDINGMTELVKKDGKINMEWLIAELSERTYGLNNNDITMNPGRAWLYNEEFWGKFIRDGVFSYSYCERFQEQLPYIIRELQLRPNTRQAVMTMYDRHQDMLNWGGRDRVPCSLTYQFLLREDKLCLIYNQRSCDFVKFFPADVFLTVGLLQYVANQIGKEPGQFIHFLGSLHAFAGDLKGKDIF
jgi:thymidylate synthase